MRYLVSIWLPKLAQNDMPVAFIVCRASKEPSYICASDSKQKPDHNFPAHMLILDAKTLCLQGADCDGESENKVEEAHCWESIMQDFDSRMNLE